MMGDRAALTAMKGNEELANRTYDHALEEVWPVTVRQTIERNRNDERRHLGYIEATLREIEVETADSR